MPELNQNLETLKKRLAGTWSAGDYGSIARGLEASAEQFLERAAIRPTDALLDVACGAGQLALPAARRGARVTGIDLSPAWIEQARAQAEAQQLTIRFDVGDVEDMPYADHSFDVVISLIGAMFAPRPELAATEMLRVCRPGGRLIMGNWTAEGFIGDFFRLVGRYAPPPDMPSPLLWGDEDTVRERLAAGTSDIRLARSSLHFHYPMPPAAVSDHFIQHFGPTLKAFESLDDNGRAAFHSDLTDLWEAANTASDGTTQLDGEILEVTAVCR